MPPEDPLTVRLQGRNDSIVEEFEANEEAVVFDPDFYEGCACEHMLCGIGDFYRMRLAEKNGLRGDAVVGAHRDLERSLDGLADVLLFPVRGAIDRRRLLDQAIAFARTQDHRKRMRAEHRVTDEFGRDLEYAVDDDDTEAYWKLVEQVINEALSDVIPPAID